MYGTIFHMNLKPGQDQNLMQVFAEWESKRKPKVDGVVLSLLLKTDNDPNKFVGVAVFKDKATYTDNADHPDQDKWYHLLRELLEDDPIWEDGEFVITDIT